MSQKLNEKQATKRVILIGLVFLMAGLSALVLIGEPTPLLFLGIVFALAPFIAPSSQSASKVSQEE